MKKQLAAIAAVVKSIEAQQEWQPGYSNDILMSLVDIECGKSGLAEDPWSYRGDAALWGAK